MAAPEGFRIKESYRVRYEEVDSYGVVNHAQFAAPSGSLGAGTFGTIQGVQQATTDGDGRVVQLAGKIYF